MMIHAVVKIRINAKANPEMTAIKRGEFEISCIQSFKSPVHFDEFSVMISSNGLTLPEMSELEGSGTESTTKVPLFDTIPVVVTLLLAMMTLPVQLICRSQLEPVLHSV